MKMFIVSLILILVSFNAYAEDVNLLGYEIVSTKIVKIGPQEIESEYVTNPYVTSAPGKVYTTVIRPVLADFVLRCKLTNRTYALSLEVNQFQDKWGEWLFNAGQMRGEIGQMLPKCR